MNENEPHPDDEIEELISYAEKQSEFPVLPILLGLGALMAIVFVMFGVRTARTTTTMVSPGGHGSLSVPSMTPGSGAPTPTLPAHTVRFHPHGGGSTHYTSASGTTVTDLAEAAVEGPRQLRVHLHHYRARHGSMPTVSQGLKVLSPNPGSGTGLPAQWGPVLSYLPDDEWGRPFRYQIPFAKVGTHYTFRVSSDGPDGTAGTADDLEYLGPKVKRDGAGRVLFTYPGKGIDLARLYEALYIYHSMHGLFPTGSQGLEALAEAPTLPPHPVTPARWKKVLREEPSDSNGKPFDYDAPWTEADGTTFAFRIRAAGPDATMGTNDDLVYRQLGEVEP